jgi:hypothetical protein
MKISELTNTTVASYIRLDEPTEEELNEITMLMTAAKQFIMSYTNQISDFLDAHEDITQIYLTIIGDMFENRQTQIDKGAIENKHYIQGLNLYCNNFLPEDTE